MARWVLSRTCFALCLWHGILWVLMMQKFDRSEYSFIHFQVPPPKHILNWTNLFFPSHSPRPQTRRYLDSFNLIIHTKSASNSILLPLYLFNLSPLFHFHYLYLNSGPQSDSPTSTLAQTHPLARVTRSKNKCAIHLLKINPWLLSAFRIKPKLFREHISIYDRSALYFKASFQMPCSE